MSDTTLKIFDGINNRRLPSDLSYVDRERRSRAFVRDATNVDLTAAGTFARRPGYHRVLALDACRSLWSDGKSMYFAAAAQLFKYDGVNPPESVAALSSPFAEVSFTTTPLGIVWSDGYQLQLMTPSGQQGVNIPLPNPAPSIGVSPGGALEATTYLVAFVRMRGEQQSAMTLPQAVTTGLGDRLVITSPPQADDILVLATPQGGGTFHEVGVLRAGEVSLGISAVGRADYLLGGAAPRAFGKYAPMLPGSIVRLHRGRLLVADGAYVYCSMPYQYGLTDPLRGFVAFDGDVTMLEPVDEGVFVATAEKTWFASGGDFTDPQAFTNVLPFGAVRGTASHDLTTNNVRWFSPRGLVEGSPEGRTRLLQDDNMVFGRASGGAAVLREQSGHRTVVTALRAAAPPGSAVSSSFMDAEVFDPAP